ncbi:Non-specific lipid-transfer protein 8 [Capsicum annuum]|nr:Non-specific lipid-transfer protein 8 [Capsicum annuum]
MTPCCRILIPRRSNSFLGLPFKKTHHSFSTNSPNFRLNFRQKCDFDSYPSRILGPGRIINRTQKLFCVLGKSSLGQFRVFSSYCNGGGDCSKRGFHVIASVASRNYSTSIEKTRVNDKNFERIYVQGGLNNVKKPLVVEKDDLDEQYAAATEQHLNEEKATDQQYAGASESAITCGTVISTIRPCFSYLQGVGGKPPQTCCAGCKSLASATSSAADRQAACTCLKNASQNVKINAQLAQSLPKNCGISLSFPISNTVDCTKGGSGVTGIPPSACCAGVSTLSQIANNTANTAIVCRCVHSVFKNLRITDATAKALPRRCGVTLPFSFSPHVKCPGTSLTSIHS